MFRRKPRDLRVSFCLESASVLGLGGKGVGGCYLMLSVKHCLDIVRRVFSVFKLAAGEDPGI